MRRLPEEVQDVQNSGESPKQAWPDSAKFSSGTMMAKIHFSKRSYCKKIMLVSEILMQTVKGSIL